MKLKHKYNKDGRFGVTVEYYLAIKSKQLGRYLFWRDSVSMKAINSALHIFPGRRKHPSLLQEELYQQKREDGDLVPNARNLSAIDLARRK